MADIFTIKAAISSVALSHDEGCECLTCRAAHGDHDAFVEVLVQVQQAEERKGGGLMAEKQPLYSYWLSYYLTNRAVYKLTRRAAAIDAVKVTWSIRNVRGK